MNAVIDRFEGKYAVITLDDGETIDVLKRLLPDGIFEGCHLQITFDSQQTIEAVQIDLEATEAARRRIQQKLERLRRNEHLKKD